eukprot:TRINITY_DN6575_c0_g2_i1.p1 TRINITY_DN6575_c0_g2~~TRINITY_DN6575_c0_g2_i1.p1  ORF type:complete len:282 (+),score=64.02 TRINITY_DN6575_c0_g2_i1:1157-2002(+)
MIWKMKKEYFDLLYSGTSQVPPLFILYFKYVTNLHFQEKPNYKYLKGLFLACMKEKYQEETEFYDWNKLDRKDMKWVAKVYLDHKIQRKKRNSLKNLEYFDSFGNSNQRLVRKRYKKRKRSREEDEDENVDGDGHRDKKEEERKPHSYTRRQDKKRRQNGEINGHDAGWKTPTRGGCFMNRQENMLQYFSFTCESPLGKKIDRIICFPMFFLKRKKSGHVCPACRKPFKPADSCDQRKPFEPADSFDERKPFKPADSSDLSWSVGCQTSSTNNTLFGRSLT